MLCYRISVIILDANPNYEYEPRSVLHSIIKYVDKKHVFASLHSYPSLSRCRLSVAFYIFIASGYGPRCADVIISPSQLLFREVLLATARAPERHSARQTKFNCILAVRSNMQIISMCNYFLLFE